MESLEPLVQYLLQIARAGELTFGEILAVTLTQGEIEFHQLPPGVLDHSERLLDLIGTPDQALIVLLVDPGDLPHEIRQWHHTRTLIANKGVWLHDPIVTNLRRWWQLSAGQSALYGPGNEL